MNRTRLLVGPAIATALVLGLIVLVACAPAAPTAPAPESEPAAEESGVASGESTPEEEAPTVAPETPEVAAEASEVAPEDTPVPGEECVSIGADGDPSMVACDNDAGLRTAACEDIVPFQGNAAFTLNDEDKLLGWTFGVNFGTDALVADQPVGCLRLYARDETLQTYVPIDNGGILVNTCTIEGDVPIGSTAANFCTASNLTTPRGVRCSVNLEGWLQAGAFTDYLARNYPDASDPVTKFVESPDHQYENFAMIAKASWQEEQCVLDDARLPVVRYLHGGTPLSLALTSTADRTFQFDASCPENQPTWDESGAHHWLWYNVISDTAHTSPHLTYDHQRDNEPVESCDPGAGDATVNFFIGPAELWIGFDPDTDESFMGDLDGILIDPYDSKPPVSGNID